MNKSVKQHTCHGYVSVFGAICRTTPFCTSDASPSSPLPNLITLDKSTTTHITTPTLNVFQTRIVCQLSNDILNRRTNDLGQLNGLSKRGWGHPVRSSSLTNSHENNPEIRGVVDPELFNVEILVTATSILRSRCMDPYSGELNFPSAEAKTSQDSGTSRPSP